MPGGLVAVGVGTLLAWITGIAPGATPPLPAGLQPPGAGARRPARRARGPHLLAYFSVILPMGLFNVVGSLQNIETAEAAGDPYPTAPSLAVNGLGSVAAACFGSCFPTTIYIGHPGWKAMGARSGYSVLNGVFVTVVCLTGTLSHIAWGVPIDAGMAIVLWIGIVITAQAFQATPAAARAGGRDRAAARHRRLGRADGEERAARRRRRHAGRAAVRAGAAAGVPGERHLDRRRASRSSRASSSPP